MFIRNLLALSVAAALLTGAVACGGEVPSSGNVSSLPSAQNGASAAGTVSFDLPSEPTVGTADAVGTLITLHGDTATVSGEGATAQRGLVTVTSPGTYTVTGSFTGQLRVNVAEKEKVTLVLNGVSVTCPDSAALYILSCPKKAVLSLAEGSVNLLTDGGEYNETVCDPDDGDIPDAALYSRDDLKISGNGTLYVTSKAHRGIHGKDDVEIESGCLFVEATDDGISGKDSVTVSGGSLAVSAGGNGIRSAGTETESGTGHITVSGGEVSVTSQGDGLDATATITLSGGTVSLLVGGGYENGEGHQDDFGGGFGGGFPGGGGFGGGGGDFGGGGGRPGRMSAKSDGFSVVPLAAGTSETASDSHKGVKAGEILTVSGGTLSVNASDDAIHCDGTSLLQGGNLYLQSGDDGIHAETELDISDGVIDVATSYEGLEGDIIRLSGGTCRITASDDGINAGTSTSGMGFGGGFGGRPGGFGGGSVASEPTNNGLFITGGYTVINASGDGLDSNADISMDGGFVLVYGPESNGNGALDYGEGCVFRFTSGTLLAVGSSGMAEDVTVMGEGGQLAFTMNGQADTLLVITDESGTPVLRVTPPKSYQSVVFASDTLLKNGSTYTVSAGGTCDGTAADGWYTEGNCEGHETLGSLQAEGA